MKRFIYSLCIIAAGALWGVMGVFVRALREYGYSSMQITSIRLCGGTLMIFIFVLLFARGRLKISLRDLPVFLAIGFGSILLMSYLYFSAILETSLSVAAILLYTAPIFVLLASVLFYGESITKRKIAALALAFAGCVMVSGPGGGNVSPKGIMLGIGSGVAYALYSIIGKKALQKYHPFTVTLYSFLFAAVGTLIFVNPAQIVAVALSAPQKPLSELIVLSVGIGAVTVFAAYMLYTFGLSKTPAGKSAIMASVEPMVATLSGFVFFHEVPDALGFIGIALILGAIVLLNTGARETEKTLDKKEHL